MRCGVIVLPRFHVRRFLIAQFPNGIVRKRKTAKLLEVNGGFVKRPIRSGKDGKAPDTRNVAGCQTQDVVSGMFRDSTGKAFPIDSFEFYLPLSGGHFFGVISVMSFFRLALFADAAFFFFFWLFRFGFGEPARAVFVRVREFFRRRRRRLG